MNTETVTSVMTEDQRRETFGRMFSAIPDEPRGQRVATAARWMCASESSVYIWSAPNARKVPSASKLMLLEQNLVHAGITIAAD